MANAVVLLAEGFEEIEAITIVDVLRRARIDVTTVSLGGQTVRGSHQISVLADATLDAVGERTADAIVLPGGMPGSANLRDDPRVMELVRKYSAQHKLVCAICAAPIALEAAGVLEGRRATCYPGYDLPSAVFEEERVVEDSNVITSRGPGTAMEFAIRLVDHLAGRDVSAGLRRGMLVR
ncbi:MAG: DJ-1/PfpI family protein [Polyangiaceae bacterium]|nr:DJ-1/PfpI family protein [Polyangiaceae bacterium]